MISRPSAGCSARRAFRAAARRSHPNSNSNSARLASTCHHLSGCVRPVDALAQGAQHDSALTQFADCGHDLRAVLVRYFDVVGFMWQFSAPPQQVLDALTFCDLTTGPDGTAVSPRDRLHEVLQRYGPDDPVHRAVDSVHGELLAAVDRVRAWL